MEGKRRKVGCPRPLERRRRSQTRYSADHLALARCHRTDQAQGPKGPLKDICLGHLRLRRCPLPGHRSYPHLIRHRPGSSKSQLRRHDRNRNPTTISWKKILGVLEATGEFSSVLGELFAFFDQRYWSKARFLAPYLDPVDWHWQWCHYQRQYQQSRRPASFSSSSSFSSSLEQERMQQQQVFYEGTKLQDEEAGLVE